MTHLVEIMTRQDVNKRVGIIRITNRKDNIYELRMTRWYARNVLEQQDQCHHHMFRWHPCTIWPDTRDHLYNEKKVIAKACRTGSIRRNGSIYVLDVKKENHFLGLALSGLKYQ
jgi:hypothetical protein